MNHNPFVDLYAFANCQARLQDRAPELAELIKKVKSKKRINKREIVSKCLTEVEFANKDADLVSERVLLIKRAQKTIIEKLLGSLR